ncbi:hypothetical protein LIER_26203 [Lithospermum erythrorhizon]|uniref:Secreted protein n=1 Tax=Lithospermum erythrorhizon TaxID=34254 RepID=A0AAV3R7S0_LITER
MRRHLLARRKSGTVHNVPLRLGLFQVLIQQGHIPRIVADFETETLHLLLQRFHLKVLLDQLLAQLPGLVYRVVLPSTRAREAEAA